MSLLIRLSVLAMLVVACGGPGMTPVPPGYPLNPCPVVGVGAVSPIADHDLVPPRGIAFAFESWHNETPSSFVCGAHSVRVAKVVIRRSELKAPIVPWAATFRRSVPLVAPEEAPPIANLYFRGEGGEVFVETIHSQLEAQFGAMGNAFDGMTEIPLGQYRMELVSLTDEIVAEGRFVIVE